MKTFYTFLAEDIYPRRTPDLIDQLEDAYVDGPKVWFDELYDELVKRALKKDPDAIKHLDTKYGTYFASPEWVKTWKRQRK